MQVLYYQYVKLFFRAVYFNNKALKTLDAVKHTLCKGFQYLMHHPVKLKSLTDYSFMNIIS
jgi:hypothetical protein